MISVDDSSSEDGEDSSDEADVNLLLLRGGGKHGDTDDEGIERDHDAGIDVIDLEQPQQQSSLESESSSTSTSAGRQPGRQRQRQHRSRGDRGGGGGETDPEVVATVDGSIEKVLSLCCNHLVSPEVTKCLVVE